MDPTQSPPETTISELPNDVLTDILSLLSTKEAVHTSLLVEMFQKLWAAVPALHFDFNEFRQDKEDICVIEEKFKKFVNGVFEHRDPEINLDSFKLKWDEDESNPIHATKWLDSVAELKPKFLSVHISTKNYSFRVPNSIFSCKSLQEMELHLGFEAIIPTSVNLPCLKKVTLDSIRIEDEVMQKLSGLPALEEMVLSNCHFNTCDISSGTLKRLVLNGYHNGRTTPPDISISTPNLLYLEVHSWQQGSIKLKKLVSLVTWIN